MKVKSASPMNTEVRRPMSEMSVFLQVGTGQPKDSTPVLYKKGGYNIALGQK
jgi:hypothetical protein